MAVALYSKNPISVKSVCSRDSSQLSSGSTPHAPRRKRYAYNVPGQPPMRSALKTHSYLDETQIDLKKGNECISPKPAKPVQAWVEKITTPTSTTNIAAVTVKPFRRTLGPEPPEGVTLLDLSHLNEPDEVMQPVQLLPPPLATNDTQRSNVSWGVVPLHGDIRGSEMDMEKRTPHIHVSSTPHVPSSCEIVEDLECSNEPEKHPTIVDKSVLSNKYHEVAQTPSAPPLPVLGDRGLGTQVQTPLAPPLPVQEGRGLGTLELNQEAAEAILSKRIFFGARMLTQNGRNVHKKLIGYYFLTDNSIAIYEFRQFGSRSSALPAIQRGVYCHLTGCKKGQLYQINSIKKGATLHFSSAEHPSLSNKGGSNILRIRITSVDESAKRQLLFADKSLAEQKALEEYINEPVSDLDEKYEGLLCTLQGMLRCRLQGRASKTLVGLGRHLEKIADSNGIVGKSVLHQSLRTFHIGLTNEDFEHLWNILRQAGVSSTNGLYIDGSVLALVGEMTEDRKALILQVFQKLDSRRTGTVSLDEMHKFFNPHSHPDVVEGKKSPEEAWFALFNCLCPSTNDTIVNYRDFEHYYEGVSIETKSDTLFMSSIKNYWSLR